jgi:hypothetical protein
MEEMVITFDANEAAMSGGCGVAVCGGSCNQ